MWYAIIETATGRLHSVATVLAEEMPEEYTVIELGENFSSAGKEWDTEKLGFVPDRSLDRFVDPIFETPGMNRLSTSERRGVRSALERMLRGETL